MNLAVAACSSQHGIPSASLEKSCQSLKMNLAVTACLSQHGIPSVLLEKNDCIFYELPLLGFPEDFLEYPSRQQFISYNESYAAKFSIKLRFRQWVKTAKFDSSFGLWRV
uniref:indole-3-pyruvate monooxygenase n=1 Tax=Nelumbo nucifera TaxID=4432 RepID=A0A822ZCE4_NELNU|nr:TPA_asm: hypothetical protein HUJ06_000433 [Nelumbo nucifera]